MVINVQFYTSGSFLKYQIYSLAYVNPIAHHHLFVHLELQLLTKAMIYFE